MVSYLVLKINLTIAGLIGLIAVSFSTANGQVVTYKVQDYTKENGLPSQQIYNIANHPSGYLIFSGTNELVKYDGFRWSIIPGTDTLGQTLPNSLVVLPSGQIAWLAQDKNKVWINLADRQQINRIEIADSYSKNTKHLAFTYNPGTSSYVITFANRLYYIKPTGEIKSFELPAKLYTVQVNQLQYYNNQLLLCTSNGLYFFNEYTQRFRRYWPDKLSGKHILKATLSNDGQTLYLLGNNWLAQCKKNTIEILDASLFSGTSSNTPQFNNIVVLNKHNLIVNHNQALGIFNLKTRKLKPFRLSAPYTGILPLAINKDLEGNTWFATARGLGKVNSFGFATMDKVAGLPDSEVSALLETSDKRLIIGTNLGINILSHGGWSQLIDEPDLHSPGINRVLEIYEDVNTSAIYIAGNEKGLGLLNTNYLQWHPLPEQQSATCIVKMRGKILVGTHQGRIYEFTNQKKWKLAFVLSHKAYCRRLIVNQEGKLLALTSIGGWLIDQNKISYFTSGNSVVNHLYDFALYKGDSLLATKAGLARIQKGKIHLFEDKVFNLGVPIYSLEIASDSSLWLGTDQGLYRYNNGKVKHYDSNSGLIGNEVNRTALLENSSGQLLVGTDRGLNIYDKTLEKLYSQPPKVILNALVYDNEALPAPKKLETGERGKPIRLPYSDTGLEAQFTAVTFSNPQKTVFRYKLKGLENDWNYSNNYLQTNVKYPALRPGRYVFKVQASVDNINWSPEAHSLLIHVIPPWYLSWWAIALYSLVLIAIGYLIYLLNASGRIQDRLRQAFEKTRADARLSESKFRSIWEGIETGLLVVNPEGKILMANPATQKLNIAGTKNLIGLSVDNIFSHPNLKSSFIQNYYKNPQAFRFELLQLADGADQHLLVTFSMIDGIYSNQPYLIISFKDITTLKSTELSNQRLNKLLSKQNRTLLRKEGELASSNRKLLSHQHELQEALEVLEARNFELDQFVYKTSHDLRAPISSALGLLNLMQIDTREDSWKQYAALIEKSLKKQDSFISAMLNFSKSARAQVSIEEIDLPKTLQQCFAELSHLPNHHQLELSVRYKPHDKKFYGENMKTQIVLTNILANSVRFQDFTKKSRLEAHIELQSKKAIIIITDNGVGIESSYLNRIFDMFYRASELSDGSGLGLYIVKQTLERLGGHIEVESEVGIGTSFRIELPNHFLSITNRVDVEESVKN